MLIHEVINETAEPPDLTFRVDHKASHHGQHDYALVAFLHDQAVAEVDYVVYQSKPSIQMIDVSRRRQGIGTAMLRHLQSLFPDTEIDWGMMTDDGSALYGSLTFQDIPNPVYAKLQIALQRTRAKLSNYARQAEMFYANPSEEARLKLQTATTDWDDLHAREYKIERVLHGMKPSKRLIA
jgi:hypothetical protein